MTAPTIAGAVAASSATAAPASIVPGRDGKRPDSPHYLRGNAPVSTTRLDTQLSRSPGHLAGDLKTTAGHPAGTPAVKALPGGVPVPPSGHAGEGAPHTCAACGRCDCPGEGNSCRRPCDASCGCPDYVNARKDHR